MNDRKATSLESKGNALRGWTHTTLGEIVQRGNGVIETGPFGSQLHANDYVMHGVPVVMPVNIGDNRLIESGIMRITPEKAVSLSRHFLRKGDIIVSRRGDIERRALVREAQDGWFCGTGCMKIRLGNGPLLPEYASYYLARSDIRDWLRRHAVGITMPNINTGILEAIPVALPPLHTQATVTEVLRKLDSKLDLNRQMNQTLEQAASAIFKSWFIDFDPVRAKANGAKSFPMMPQEGFDTLPSSLEAHGELNLPTGWRLGTLEDVAMNVRDQIDPAAIDPECPYVGLEHMPRCSIALDAWGRAETVDSQKFKFVRGQILFGKLRPYFHKVGRAVVNGVCSTDIVVLNGTAERWTCFALMVVSSPEFVRQVNIATDGTKMPRTSWDYMKRYPIALPSTTLVDLFNGLVSPLVEAIERNIFESRTLTHLRDTLLPKLLSGKVRVRELPAEVMP